MGTSRTTQLLVRWHDGDLQARTELIERHESRILARVQTHYSRRLDGRLEKDDIVQEVLLSLLKKGPRFVPKSGAQFRAMMTTMIINTIRDQNRWFSTQKRDIVRQNTDPNYVLDFTVERRPEQELEDRERRAAIQLGYELMEPESRRVHLMRFSDELSFRAIGEELGITEEAARKRCETAGRRLADTLRSLREGNVDDLLD